MKEAKYAELDEYIFSSAVHTTWFWCVVRCPVKYSHTNRKILIESKSGIEYSVVLFTRIARLNVLLKFHKSVYHYSYNSEMFYFILSLAILKPLPYSHVPPQLPSHSLYGVVTLFFKFLLHTNVAVVTKQRIRMPDHTFRLHHIIRLYD